MPQLETIKIRADFLRLRGCESVRSNFCGVQGAARNQEFANKSQFLSEDNAPRIGFIITKKIGNAVVRNRIRRRLKAVLAKIQTETSALHNGWDYVFFPKVEVASMPYDELNLNLRNSLNRFKA